MRPSIRIQHRPPGTRRGRTATLEMDRLELSAVLAGGSIGALARAGLIELFPVDAGTWPWPTFIANILGALALGYFTTRLQERLPLSAYRRPLLGTGLCGALTTFSAMQLELVRLMEHGDWTLALAYATASVAIGFGAVLVAGNLVRRVRVAR